MVATEHLSDPEGLVPGSSPSPPQRARRELLERAGDLQALEALVRNTAKGSGGSVAVLGPAGIGKTSLLDAVRAHATDLSLVVLVARGSELESDFSYGVVRQLFEPAVVALSDADRARVFAGAAAAAGAILSIGADPIPASQRDAMFAVLHGLYWLCTNLSQRQPLVLVVDDLQWADGASLRFLEYVQRRVGELPIAVVTAARPGADGAQAELVDRVTSAPLAVTLNPSLLSEEAVGRLIENVAGAKPTDAFVRSCHGATLGNPFLCETLVSALAEEGITTADQDLGRVVTVAARAVSTVVVRRLGRLSPQAAALAKAVAVLGDDVELHVAALLAGMDEAQAADTVDGLAELGILRVTPALRFSHPLVRASVYDRIPAAQRALLHGRAALLLRDRSAEVPRVAVHLLLSERAATGWVAGALRAAGRMAVDQGDPASAVSYLRRAIREPPDPSMYANVLHELGVAELMAGDVHAAGEHLAEAHNRTADSREQATIAHDLALALSTAGRYPDAVAALERSADHVASVDADGALGLEAELHQCGLMHPTEYRRVSTRIARLDPDVSGTTPGQRALLAALATEACLRNEPAALVRDRAGKAFAQGLLDDHAVYASLWGNAAFPLVFAEGYDVAATAADAAIADASRRGSPIGLARGYAVRSMIELRRGDLRDAESDARAAVELGLASGYLVSLIPLGVLVEVLVECDRVDAADAELADAHRGDSIAERFLENWVLHGRGWLRLAQGRLDAAIADFDELARRGRESWRPWNPGIFAYRSGLALAHWRNGNHGAAQTLAAEELALSRRWGGARAIGISLRTAGQVQQGDEGIARLQESVAVLAAAAARLEYARSLVELGAAVRRRGSRTQASGLLHEGMALAGRCGGSALIRQAREELVSLGERPRRTAVTGTEALTPSELRVARLAAGGMTNRDIAQSLFVTLRTVEVHLTNAYRKLGISSRAQLARAMADDPNGA